jgi:hypothetical protein
MYSAYKNINYFDEKNLKFIRTNYRNFDEFKSYWDKSCSERFPEILNNAIFFEEICEDEIQNSKIVNLKIVKRLHSYIKSHLINSGERR